MSDQPQAGSVRVRLGTSGFMIFLAFLYIAEGLGQPSGLLAQPMRYMLVKFGWTPLQISAYIEAAMLPWVFKPIFGVITDNFPLLGYRRKSWLLVANVVALAGFWWVGYTNSLTEMQWALVLTALGMAMTTAVAGALLVEVGKTGDKSSMFVSQQWLFFSLAALATAHFGGVLTQRFAYQPWGAVHIAALVVSVGPVLSMLAAVLFIREQKAAPATRGVGARLWGTFAGFITNWRVWGVSIFIFLYFYNPGFGQPLYNYQTKVLGLSQEFIGNLGMWGAAGSIVGTVLYMLGSRFISLRNITLATILIGAPLQASSIIFTTPSLAPFGLENTAILLSVLGGAVGMIGMLAACTLAVDYCPPGSEGMTYAWLMAVHNLTNPASDISGSWLYQTWFTNDLQGLILVSAAVTLIALPAMYLFKIGKASPTASGNK